MAEALALALVLYYSEGDDIAFSNLTQNKYQKPREGPLCASREAISCLRSRV